MEDKFTLRERFQLGIIYLLYGVIEFLNWLVQKLAPLRRKAPTVPPNYQKPTGEREWRGRQP